MDLQSFEQTLDVATKFEAGFAEAHRGELIRGEEIHQIFRRRIPRGNLLEHPMCAAAVVRSPIRAPNAASVTTRVTNAFERNIQKKPANLLVGFILWVPANRTTYACTNSVLIYDTSFIMFCLVLVRFADTSFLYKIPADDCCRWGDVVTHLAKSLRSQDQSFCSLLASCMVVIKYSFLTDTIEGFLSDVASQVQGTAALFITDMGLVWFPFCPIS